MLLCLFGCSPIFLIIALLIKNEKFWLNCFNDPVIFPKRNYFHCIFRKNFSTFGDFPKVSKNYIFSIKMETFDPKSNLEKVFFDTLTKHMRNIQNKQNSLPISDEQISVSWALKKVIIWIRMLNTFFASGCLFFGPKWSIFRSAWYKCNKERKYSA